VGELKSCIHWTSAKLLKRFVPGRTIFCPTARNQRPGRYRLLRTRRDETTVPGGTARHVPGGTKAAYAVGRNDRTRRDAPFRTRKNDLTVRGGTFSVYAEGRNRASSTDFAGARAEFGVCSPQEASGRFGHSVGSSTGWKWLAGPLNKRWR